MQTKKKTAIIAVVALLVCVAIYLNWSYQSGLDSTDVSGTLVSSDADRLAARDNGGSTQVSPNLDAYFAQIRLTRQKARDEAITLLQDTIAADTADAPSKDRAVETMSTIADNAVVESRIEGLVIAKGYSDCAVFINSDGLSVVVAPPQGGLKSADASRIKDIAVNETGVRAENVRIIEARIG